MTENQKLQADIDRDGNLVLHRMKKIEIIVKGEKRTFITELLEEAGATGFTIIRDVAGRGATGSHEGRLLFNDDASLVMFVVVAPEQAVRRIVAGIRPLLEQYTGVVFVCDVEVLRYEHFSKKPHAR